MLSINRLTNLNQNQKSVAFKGKSDQQIVKMAMEFTEEVIPKVLYERAGVKELDKIVKKYLPDISIVTPSELPREIQNILCHEGVFNPVHMPNPSISEGIVKRDSKIAIPEYSQLSFKNMQQFIATVAHEFTHGIEFFEKNDIVKEFFTKSIKKKPSQLNAVTTLFNELEANFIGTLTPKILKNKRVIKESNGFITQTGERFPVKVLDNSEKAFYEFTQTKNQEGFDFAVSRIYNDIFNRHKGSIESAGEKEKEVIDYTKFRLKGEILPYKVTSEVAKKLEGIEKADLDFTPMLYEKLLEFFTKYFN